MELIGLPGSGKTRLARRLAQELRERGVLVSEPQAALGPQVPMGRRLTRKAAASGAVAFSAPAVTRRITWGILRSRQPRWGDAAGRLVQLLVARDLAARAARQPGVSILDEGLVQSLWSVGLRGSVLPVLTALDGAATRPLWSDILVVVQIPAEEALVRLRARASQHSRTQLLDAGAGLAELQRGAALVEELVDWWAAHAGHEGEVFVVAGLEECTDDRERLIEHVCKRLQAAG